MEISIRGLNEILSIDRAYGMNVRYIGYPSEQGGTHFISTDSPVAIRKNATREEKKAAYAFLREWMSYDSQIIFLQRNVNNGISIRNDVMEKQIESVVHRELENITDRANTDYKQFEKELLEKTKFLKEIVEEARPQRKLPRDLKELMWDELTEYFKGNITQEQVTNHLKNRILLYVEENQNKLEED